ncbi:hypothetical protein BBJ29_002530 [Phytophthora kernoviae]|uniref:CobW C-terminal domain-containing protein n=1 Tax=Phytophthora kernoviae TaxID=325452 RepID=A0A3F2RQK0_9STRA|nr:hypothetical protein BBJ29_002530 [Phytophthora kernoviae]RLN62353.1 hypothetical protein BBP00_00004816 [Phytophthora kernoviae]
MARTGAHSPTAKRPLANADIETDKKNSKHIPVTLLSGFLGSGKTTLLQHILKNKDHALRVAVIVNDMGELNIDANLVASAGVLQREEQLVRLENGCICCTLRVDLLEQIARIAQQGEVDYIVIESSGISEPMQVAETFVFELPGGVEEDQITTAKPDPSTSPSKAKRSRTESNASSAGDTTTSSTPASPTEKSVGIPSIQLDELLVRNGETLPLLRDIAHLDTCVTVVDAATFFHVFDDPRMLADIEEHRSQLPEGDTRTLTDLLIDQIEFADVILLNKTDLVPAKDVEAIEKVLRRLNSYAKIERTVKGRVSPKMILGTKLFSFERASQQTGWLESLTVPHTPETLDKGVFWLGTRSFNYGTLSQAGLYCTLANGGMWIAALPEDERTRTMKELPNYSDLMAREHGDRGQELVFIGRFSQEDDEIARIRGALDSCLLTDEEMKKYKANDIEDWEDPFEPWEYYTFED